MRYYLTLCIIAVIVIAAYQTPEPPKVAPVKQPPPEPVGAVGSDLQPPAGSF